MFRCKQMAVIVLLAFFGTVANAHSSKAKETLTSQPVMVACEDPRPQMCTMQFDPVCGLTGGDQYKTYSNACSACSDASVSAYSAGACE